MTMTAACSLKENEAQAWQHLEAFWAGSSLGRPAILAFAWPDGKPPERRPQLGPEERLRQEWTTEYQRQQAEYRMTDVLYLGEAMPHATLTMGCYLPLLPCLAGGEYSYHSDTAWTHPIPDLWDQPLPRFDPNNRIAAFVSRALAAMAGQVGRRGFVNMPVYLDPLTTLGELRGQDKLLLDLIEEPEMVRRWLTALTDIYIESYAYFHRQLCELGYGPTACWLGVPSPRKMEAVQCDFSVNISPEMFERFVLPDLQRETQFLDHSLYHLDGVCQMRFLDHLCQCPRLSGIQWNAEPWEGRPILWLEAMRAIRARKRNLFVWCNVDEAVTITRELGPDGLVLCLPEIFTDPGQAQKAIQRIARAC